MGRRRKVAEVVLPYSVFGSIWWAWLGMLLSLLQGERRGESGVEEEGEIQRFPTRWSQGRPSTTKEKSLSSTPIREHRSRMKHGTVYTFVQPLKDSPTNRQPVQMPIHVFNLL